MKYTHRQWLTLSAILYASSLLFGGIVVIFTDKASLHLALHQWHSPYADVFFQYITHIGDGAFPVLLLPLLLMRYRFNVLVLCATACVYAGIAAQFFKRIVFRGTPRPHGFFEEGTLRVIEGVSTHHHHSFPSGHTTSVVVLCLFLAFLSKGNKLAQIAFFVLAALVGFSRVYLSHHFIEDVLAGVFLGSVMFWLAYQTIGLLNKKAPFMQKRIKRTLQWKPTEIF